MKDLNYLYRKLFLIGPLGILLSTSILSIPAIAQEARDKKFPVPNSIDVMTPHKVGLFTNYASIAPTCKVARSDNPLALQRSVKDIANLKVDNLTVSDYIKKYNVMGFLVLRDGVIVDQQHRFERRETDLFTSMSVAKSIVSILVGIALDEGLISSLDDPVGKYALKIKNSSYGSLPIRSLLQMSSGVPFVEQYPVKSKTDIYDFAVEAQYGKNSSIIRAINNIKKQSNGYGKVFNYASVETAVLVEVLRSASKQSLCSFMQERLWKPIGAEHDANWNIDSEGLEWGFGWLNATQADLAKVGILLTNGGEINGKQVVSKKYLEEATSLEKQPMQFKKVNDVNEPSKNAGYGYQFWLTDTPGRFFMQGIFGQYVVIDQPSKTVMIINSADSSFLSDNRTKETLMVFGKLLEQNF